MALAKHTHSHPCGLLKPTSGGIFLDDKPADFSEAAVRRAIGLILHQTFLYEQLTGLENLQLYAKLYEAKLSEADLRQSLARVGLAKVRPVPVRNYPADEAAPDDCPRLAQ